MSLAMRSLTGKCNGSWDRGRGCYICIATDNTLTDSACALARWSVVDHHYGETMSASLAVYRNIYTEDRFKQAFGSDDDTSGSLRLREKLVGRCGCSRRACLHLLKQRVPIFNWLPRYRPKKWILGDTIAGLTVGILHIPQGETSSELEQLITGCQSQEGETKDCSLLIVLYWFNNLIKFNSVKWWWCWWLGNSSPFQR